MAWPESGNTELLTLTKLIAWVYQFPSIRQLGLIYEMKYLIWDDGNT